jgi:CMP-N-acetylneuraminic acid synthetase
VLVVLQPTSPLRRAEHIDGAIELLLATGADSVVSVVEVPHQFNPISVLRIESGRAVRYLDGPLILRRQDKPRVYARNGPAVVAVHRATVVDRGTLYGDDCRAYVMSPEVSIDIDTPLDLAVAGLLLSHAVAGERRA